MISDVRELKDAELDAVAGGLDLGSVADAVGAAASAVGRGGAGLGMRKSAGEGMSGQLYLVFQF